MEFPVLEQVVFLATATLAWMTFAYGDCAEMRGWPAGTIYQRGHPVLLIPSAISAMFAIVGSFFIIAWWSVLVTAVGGFFLAIQLTHAFKAYTQLICFVGTYIAWMWSGLLVSEYFFLM